MKLIASGMLDDTKSVEQCGLENDRIVFYVLKLKGQLFCSFVVGCRPHLTSPLSLGLSHATTQHNTTPDGSGWEDIDVEKLQPAVPGKPPGPGANAAGARPLSSPMAPSQTPSASALAQFQTNYVQAQQFGSSLGAPPTPYQK